MTKNHNFFISIVVKIIHDWDLNLPVNIYLFKSTLETLEKGVIFKVNNKTPEKRHWCRSVFINFEHLSHVFLVFLFFTLNK